MPTILYIGNKNYSSWSFRPWLALRVTGVPFEERLYPLYEPEGQAAIRAVSPSGMVPLLDDDGVKVWESLAIIDYVAETRPHTGLWPADRAARAFARSVAAEMHAGFADLRRNMSVNIRRRFPGQGRTPESLADIARVTAIWREARARFGEPSGEGPFLFGRFGAADAMYAPVVTRFRTYAYELDPVCEAYAQALEALPAFAEWTAAAAAEPWVRPGEAP